MDREERMALTATHPGVRRLKTAHQCQGWKAGTTWKKLREGRAPQCKNPAYWHFTPLKWKRIGFTEPQYVCWSHLVNGGLYGDMDETARTERWLARMERKVADL